MSQRLNLINQKFKIRSLKKASRLHKTAQTNNAPPGLSKEELEIWEKGQKGLLITQEEYDKYLDILSRIEFQKPDSALKSSSPTQTSPSNTVSTTSQTSPSNTVSTTSQTSPSNTVSTTSSRTTQPRNKLGLIESIGKDLSSAAHLIFDSLVKSGRPVLIGALGALYGYFTAQDNREALKNVIKFGLAGVGAGISLNILLKFLTEFKENYQGTTFWEALDKTLSNSELYNRVKEIGAWLIK